MYKMLMEKKARCIICKKGKERKGQERRVLCIKTEQEGKKKINK